MSYRNPQLVAYLDETYGAASGAGPGDYDSPEDLLRYAIESVSEQDGLTQGCGVGPLVSQIEAWVASFVAGERADVSNEPFCLQIKFDPLRLGFTNVRSADELIATFGQPSKLPSSYPVLARQEGLSGRTPVLSYLHHAEVHLVP